MLRKFWYAGFLVFIGLLILAVIFCQERMIFSDASLYLYNMVRYQQFAVFHDRFIAVGSQVPAWWAVHNGWPLDQVLQAFSCGLVLFPLLLYLLAGWADKSCRLAICILLINILITRETFYWPLSELVQGMGLLLLLFAMLVRTKTSTALSVLVLLLLLPVVVFAHPLMILPFSYLVAFYYLRKDEDIRRRTLVIASLLFLVALVLKFTVFRDPYDKGSLGGLRNFFRLFPDYLFLYSNKELLLRLVTTFAAFTLVAACICYSYFRRKSWWPLALFLGYTLACIGFVNICFPYSYTDAFYRENLYMPLALFAALPFVYDVLPRWRPQYIKGIALLAIAVFGLVRIYDARDFFSRRLGYLNSFLEAHGTEKLVIREQPFHKEQLALTWGTPYEFWLLSTIQTGQTASLMIRDTLVPLPQYRGEPDVFLHRFGAEPYSAYPRTYFIFKDSSTAYNIQPQ